MGKLPNVNALRQLRVVDRQRYALRALRLVADLSTEPEFHACVEVMEAAVRGEVDRDAVKRAEDQLRDAVLHLRYDSFLYNRSVGAALQAAATFHGNNTDYTSAYHAMAAVEIVAFAARDHGMVNPTVELAHYYHELLHLDDIINEVILGA